jgi:hypothetical protein
MFLRSGAIRCGKDIPLKVKEQLEHFETLATDEDILLFCKNLPNWKKFQTNKKLTGIILTNLRIFQITKGVTNPNIFLNEIRHVKEEKVGFKKILDFQIVNGSHKTIQIYEKDVMLYFLKLFEAILHNRFLEVHKLLQTDRELLENDIQAIFATNKDIQKIWVEQAEKLWKCNAQNGENLTDMILRILQPNQSFFKISRLWEDKIDISTVRKRLFYWSRQMGLKIPGKL